MAPGRSLKTLASRRRRADGDDDDDDDDDEESVAGMDDSQSEGTVASDVDLNVDADAEASEASDLDAAEPMPSDSGPVPSQEADRDTGRPLSKRTRRAKKDGQPSEINGTQKVEQDAVPTVSAPSTGVEIATAAAGAPIVSSQAVGSRRTETAADKRRREHDEYKRKRDSDPTFIPNRGNFFMHDPRTPDQRGFTSYGRGRGGGGGGRGRGIPMPSGSHGHSHNQVHTHMAPAERTENAPWAHDLHETVNEHSTAPAPRHRPVQAESSSHRAPPAPSVPLQPLNFSKTTQIGIVQIRVSLPGMKAAVPFAGVPWKSYTRLPDHRPPLRRDKPVRISLPDHPVRHVFPATDRSFIFIPRALRPNQQGFGKPRGSFGAYGAPASRRTSIYGGSVYSQSVSMSRRSSLARDIPRDSAFSPTGSYTARAPPGSGRPVVRLPQAGSHRSSNPSPAGSISAYGRPYPLPQKPAVEHWAESATMYQPRPQKAISMTGIESPAGLSLHAPQQQEQQPFHNQIPHHISETNIGAQPVPSDMGPPPYYPPNYMYGGGTPLSNIPERAIHAQPFQPPAPAVYHSFAPPGYYYPGQPPQYAATAAPAFLPTAGPQPGFVPAEPTAPPSLNAAESQQGTVAHESNGMVYYTQVPQYAPQDNYLQAQSYAVPGMGGMITPSPEAGYYYPPMPAGAMYYSQAQ